MKFYNWEGIPEEQMNPLVSRQVIHGETMTVARLRLRKGAVVPLHHHVNEQITLLEEGRLRFVIAGREHVVSAGEAMQIPPNAPHTVEALEDRIRPVNPFVNIPGPRDMQQEGRVGSGNNGLARGGPPVG